MALALYRKYRPRTFAEVIGQEHVTEPLSQALRSGRLHHAYLFSGPRGCGKTSSARILARSLNCEQGPTPEPCGVCASCRSLANDGAGSIDVIEIDAASHGGVDDARELREKAFFAPANSRYKIYVIDEAHMVSSAGFNALLKLVEEPPEYVKFIFATTEPEKVLGTIRSRTHHYPFRLIPPATLRPYLQQLTDAEGITVEPAVFPLVVRAGGGSARDTLSVLDQLIAGAGPDGVSYSRAVSLLGVTDVTLLDEMCDAIAAGDGAAAYATIDRVAEAGHDPRRFASDLLERFRDLIILQQVPDAVSKGLIDGPSDQLESMSAQAARLGQATLSRCADIVHNGLVEMRGTTAPRLLLELITARMLLPGADDSTGALLQRLERMEQRVSQGGFSAVRPEDAPIAAIAGAPAAAAEPDAGVAPSLAPTAGAGGGVGGGLSAARAAAKAAARRSTSPGRPAAPAAAPPSAAPAAAAPSSGAPTPAAPVSAAPVSAAAAAPAAVPVPPAGLTSTGSGAASGSEVVTPAAGVSAAAPSAPVSAGSVPASPGQAPGGSSAAEPDWNEVAGGGSGAKAEHYDDEPPWDDESDMPEPASAPAAPAPARPQPGDTARPQPGDAARPQVGDVARPQRVEPASEQRGEPAVELPPAPERRSEPAGVLPDAPEEPGAAAVEAVAAGPGQPTAEEIRQAWHDILEEVKKQPGGKVLRAAAINATVRSVDGQSVLLTVAAGSLQQRIAQGAPLIANALYEVFGSRWEVRCEIAGEGGATQVAPPRGGRPPARNDGGGQAQRPAVAAQRSAPAAQPAAAAREPQNRRQAAAAPAPSDDDWPEPVKPGGLAPPPPSTEVADDNDWPEVSPIGLQAANTPPEHAGLATEMSAVPGPSAVTASPPPSLSGAGASPATGLSSAGASPAAGVSEAGLSPSAGPSVVAASPTSGSSVAGASPASGSSVAADSSSDWPGVAAVGSAESSVAPSAPAPEVGQPAVRSLGSGVDDANGWGDDDSGSRRAADTAASSSTGEGPSAVGAAGPSAASAVSDGAAISAAQGAVAGSAASGEAGGAAISAAQGAVAGSAASGEAGGGGISAARAAAAAARAGGSSAAPADVPVGGGSGAGGPGAATVARSSGAGAGLAAARAAAAGAGRAAAGGARGGAARTAPAKQAWSDGSPTEEAPYDPEFDGPPKGGGGGAPSFEGFDPGDEPLDEVLDEKTARESGEQMAFRLLKEALGAEKIGES
ncbi:DNA polymerase III subunit gamma and tau [Actinoplanes sp. CA-131856]